MMILLFGNFGKDNITSSLVLTDYQEPFLGGTEKGKGTPTLIAGYWGEHGR